MRHQICIPVLVSGTPSRQIKPAAFSIHLLAAEHEDDGWISICGVGKARDLIDLFANSSELIRLYLGFTLGVGVVPSCSIWKVMVALWGRYMYLLHI